MLSNLFIFIWTGSYLLDDLMSLSGDVLVLVSLELVGGLVAAATGDTPSTTESSAAAAAADGS